MDDEQREDEKVEESAKRGRGKAPFDGGHRLGVGEDFERVRWADGGRRRLHVCIHSLR